MKFLGILLAGAAYVSAPAFAQDVTATAGGAQDDAASADDGAVQDVVVTANRREENVQRVAASISVVGGEKLDAQGVVNSKELTQSVPNLTIDTSFSSSTPRMYIRGVGSADSNPNSSIPIGVYVDDVYLASTNSLIFQLVDVERVEVLRGPQGTLYGRNTTAGAINYISRQPTEHLEGYGTIRLGSLDNREFQGAISGALVPGKLTARLALGGQIRDGATINPITGDNRQGEIRTFGGRLLLRYKATDDFAFTLNLHGGVSWPHSGAYKARGVFVPGSNPRVRCATPQLLAFQCADLIGQIEGPDPFRSITSDPDSRDKMHTYGANVRVEADLGFANLTSISAYDYTAVDRMQYSDGTLNRVLNIKYDQTDKTFSQELRLTSPGGDRFNWIAGLYYMDQTATADDRTHIPPSNTMPTRRAFIQSTQAAAIFGRADYALTDRLKVTAGLRYTHESRNMTISVDRNPAYYEVFKLPVPTGVAPIFYFTKQPSLSNGKITGDLTLDYRFTDTVFGYAKISKGFKSGGFNGARVYDPALVTTVAPETLTSYEAGLKTQFWDRRVTLNASGFYYDFKDLQVNTLVPINGSPTQVLDNASNAQIYGAEFEGALRPFRGLSLFGSLGLLHSEFKDFRSATTATNYSGKRMPGAPRVTASVGFNLELPVTNSLNLVSDWNSSYRSRNYFTPSQDIQLSQDGYWLTNASIGIEADDRSWKVALYSKNLFDQRYYRYMTDYSAYGLHLISVGDPVTYGVELGVRF